MYLIYITLGFIFFAIPKTDRFEWGTLALLTLLLQLNIHMTDVVNGTRYLNRTSLICLFGMVLLWRNTPLAFYQAVVLLLFLVANMCLMYDVMHDKHILIYNHFEAVIYGLVTGQFLGIIPAVRRTLYNYNASRSTPIKNNNMGYKT